MFSFRDVDAPNTSWRPGSEDPIPFLLGRYPVTAFAYRFLSGRPLDGHSRTDATFWHAGTKSRTISGHVMPYQFWPAWKRGLLLTRLPAFFVAPYTAVATLNEVLLDKGPWWIQWPGATLPWIPFGIYGGWKAWSAGVNYSFNKNYLRPLERAVVATLRTRDGVKLAIPRQLVRAKDPSAIGRIYLPGGHALTEGDRSNLLQAAQERLGASEIDGRFNLEGSRPHLELFVPSQPPRLVTWEQMMGRWSAHAPYVGETSGRSIHWDLGDDSPHVGLLGGAGSGKSELMAWIIAQFMRGGAGVVVLDPKYSSHKWLMSIPEVLYCTEPSMVHDTVLWLDEELRRRGRLSQHSDVPEPRIVVALEERNSMQSLLRDHWREIKSPGMPMLSPAIAALDRLAAQGRSLNINVILAAQEGAKVDIGSRTSFGAFALAGRLPQNVWRLVQGSGSRKPAMSSLPGRFGWVVGGQTTVFQAAFPDVKHKPAQLADWACSGDPLLNMKDLLSQAHTPTFPSASPVTAEAKTEEFVTLRQFAEANDLVLTSIRKWRDRYPGFPQSVGVGVGNASIYNEKDLSDWMRDGEPEGLGSSDEN